MASTKKVALVTGGRRGIGLGIAQRLATDSFNLVISATSPPADSADVVQQIKSLGVDCLYCQADVSDRPAREKMLHDIRVHYGRLDVLVNNAGVAPSVRADILDATEESFERLIKINLQGPYFLTQSVARWMIDQKKADAAFAGCIINVSSISASVASVNRGDYCISKAGVGMATQLWAVRLGEFDIPVYEVRPGIIATDMTAGVKGKYDTLIEQGLLLQKRWGQPADIGNAVASLARGDLAYATGQVLYVDGGLTVQRL
jgi:3-oxoacyl-[acyl-carrier protein] reductase